MKEKRRQGSPERCVAVELDADGHKEERGGGEEGLTQPQGQAGGGAHGPRRLIHRTAHSSPAHDRRPGVCDRWPRLLPARYLSSS